MSTRATYQVNGQTMYIHYDGYPEGAATYFFNMYNDSGRGDLFFNFVRGNPLAEPTESHAAHGDTEFRYTITGNRSDAFIVAEKATDLDGVWVKWETFFAGSVADFIAEYGDAKQRIVTIPHEYGEGFYAYTVEQIVGILGRQTKMLCKWRENGMTESYNYQSMEKRIKQIEAAIVEVHYEAA